MDRTCFPFNPWPEWAVGTDNVKLPTNVGSVRIIAQRGKAVQLPAFVARSAVNSRAWVGTDGVCRAQRVCTALASTVPNTVTPLAPGGLP